jgi:uncharacterized membrane protein SpoIIM required for sporulation
VSEPLPVFVERRQASWDELAGLVGQAGRRGGLDAAGVRTAGRRYREAVADLAVARRRFPGDPVTARLDALVQQARPVVYAHVVERTSVRWWVTTGFWRRVHERPVFLVVAAAALFVPMAAMALWAHADPDGAARIAGASELTAGVTQGGPRDPDSQKITDLGINAALSSQIFTNNARVALAAYAGGLTGGVLTLVSLVFNGLLVGLIVGYAIEIGAGASVWRLIVPHGVLELSLITVAGAAGLRTGWALLHPGHRTRAEALAVEGRAGVEMAIGCAVLLVPTGLIEGFVTPRGLTTPAALAVGIGAGAVFWALVLWRGRPPADA